MKLKIADDPNDPWLRDSLSEAQAIEQNRLRNLEDMRNKADPAYKEKKRVKVLWLKILLEEVEAMRKPTAMELLAPERIQQRDGHEVLKALQSERSWALDEDAEVMLSAPGLEAVMVSLPESVRQRLERLTQQTSQMCAVMGAVDDENHQFHSDRLYQDWLAHNEKFHSQGVGPSEAELASDAYARHQLVDAFHNTVLAAIKIQRAFRKFRAYCLEHGWPSDRRPKPPEPMTNPYAGQAGGNAKYRADRAAKFKEERALRWNWKGAEHSSKAKTFGKPKPPLPPKARSNGLSPATSLDDPSHLASRTSSGMLPPASSLEDVGRCASRSSSCSLPQRLSHQDVRASLDSLQDASSLDDVPQQHERRASLGASVEACPQQHERKTSLDSLAGASSLEDVQLVQYPARLSMQVALPLALPPGDRSRSAAPLLGPEEATAVTARDMTTAAAAAAAADPNNASSDPDSVATWSSLMAPGLPSGSANRYNRRQFSRLAAPSNADVVSPRPQTAVPEDAPSFGLRPHTAQQDSLGRPAPLAGPTLVQVSDNVGPSHNNASLPNGKLFKGTGGSTLWATTLMTPRTRLSSSGGSLSVQTTTADLPFFPRSQNHSSNGSTPRVSSPHQSESPRQLLPTSPEARLAGPLAPHTMRKHLNSRQGRGPAGLAKSGSSGGLRLLDSPDAAAGAALARASAADRCLDRDPLLSSATPRTRGASMNGGGPGLLSVHAQSLWPDGGVSRSPQPDPLSGGRYDRRDRMFSESGFCSPAAGPQASPRQMMRLVTMSEFGGAPARAAGLDRAHSLSPDVAAPTVADTASLGVSWLSALYGVPDASAARPSARASSDLMFVARAVPSLVARSTQSGQPLKPTKIATSGVAGSGSLTRPILAVGSLSADADSSLPPKRTAHAQPQAGKL